MSLQLRWAKKSTSAAAWQELKMCVTFHNNCVCVCVCVSELTPLSTIFQSCHHGVLLWQEHMVCQSQGPDLIRFKDIDGIVWRAFRLMMYQKCYLIRKKEALWRAVLHLPGQRSRSKAVLKWATSLKNLFISYANNKDADQPAHPRSLISIFVIH